MNINTGQQAFAGDGSKIEQSQKISGNPIDWIMIIKISVGFIVIVLIILGLLPKDTKIPW